jgi:hypothetical protein
MYGDGGQSGFSSTNDDLRFNTFTGQANDANFRGGDPTKWVIISAPIIASPEGAFFYPPVVADPYPANGGTIFQGPSASGARRTGTAIKIGAAARWRGFNAPRAMSARCGSRRAPAGSSSRTTPTPPRVP